MLNRLIALQCLSKWFPCKRRNLCLYFQINFKIMWFFVFIFFSFCLRLISESRLKWKKRRCQRRHRLPLVLAQFSTFTFHSCASSCVKFYANQQKWVAVAVNAKIRTVDVPAERKMTLDQVCNPNTTVHWIRDTRLIHARWKALMPTSFDKHVSISMVLANERSRFW